MKKVMMALLMACIIFTASCTGPFKLTKRVHKWQTGFEDRWVDEAAFLGCVILPVYSLSTLGDAIIFNSVEFWTGENPMDTVAVEGDGKTVRMVHQEDGSIRITGGKQTLILDRTDRGVAARDADGDVMYRAVKGEDGVVSVYDESGNLVKRSQS